jgi:hypothetical protein
MAPVVTTYTKYPEITHKKEKGRIFDGFANQGECLSLCLVYGLGSGKVVFGVFW